MTAPEVATGIVLGLAVGLALACCLGMALMRDPLQRLQFATPLVSWCTWLIVVAVWLKENDVQARIKAPLLAVVLFVMSSILSHATGRAVKVRRAGHWDVRPEDNIPIVGRDQPAAGEGKSHGGSP